MGDPKQHRKKYNTPSHPWQKARIDEENELKKTYGFKNKREIWKMNTVLKDFTFQAKKLISQRTPQAEKERKLLLAKLLKLGLMTPSSKVDDILGLKLKDVLERRLQTQIFRKGFANSARQARQYITHGHIVIGDKKITSPAYLLSTEEEAKISFIGTSSLSNPEHPERTIMQEKMKPKAEVKAEAKPKKHEAKSKPAEEAKVEEKKEEAKAE